jgi:hypothetical protein
MKTPDKVNDKTPEDIYKALRCLIVQVNDDCEDISDSCKDCPHNVAGSRHELATRLADTIVRIQQLERERDAAVADMTELMRGSESCTFCKHYVEDGVYCAKPPASIFTNGMCWEWRGVQEVE